MSRRRARWRNSTRTFNDTDRGCQTDRKHRAAKPSPKLVEEVEEKRRRSSVAAGICSFLGLKIPSADIPGHSLYVHSDVDGRPYSALRT